MFVRFLYFFWHQKKYKKYEKDSNSAGVPAELLFLAGLPGPKTYSGIPL